MKQKITAVLLSLVLLLTFSIGVRANEDLIVGEEVLQTNENNFDLTKVEENTNTSSRSATSGIKSGAVYRIKNVGSGKYMNVHYGTDANGANIY